jgi:hypothetical protein
MAISHVPIPRAEPDPRAGRWGFVIRDQIGSEMYRSPETYGHPQDAIAAGGRKAATLPRPTKTP